MLSSINNLNRSLGPHFFSGPLFIGEALNQTGQINIFHESSSFATILQAGNATAAMTYIFPTAGPAANNYLLASSTTGILSWLNAAGTFAPIESAFVTVGNDAVLTGERALTGTANQITITDNGANSTVVLSTPQNIHGAATPTFAGLTLTGFSGAVSASAGVLSAGTLSVGNGGTGVTSLSNIVGTSNQITVTDGTARVIGANVTLSLPQDIATASSPSFSGININGSLTMGDGNNIVLNTTTGTKIGTATTQKMGFFNASPVVQQASAANLTNNVTSGGTDDTVANYTDLTTYANDSAAIRNNIYQLARKLKQVNDALRVYGLLS